MIVHLFAAIIIIYYSYWITFLLYVSKLLLLLIINFLYHYYSNSHNDEVAFSGEILPIPAFDDLAVLPSLSVVLMNDDKPNNANRALKPLNELGRTTIITKKKTMIITSRFVF